MSPRARKHQRKRNTRSSFRGSNGPDDLDTITSFCESEKISESFYFGLKRAHKGPDEIELALGDGFGRKVVRITPAAKARWRAAREAETMARREAEKRAREQGNTESNNAPSAA